MIISSDMDIWVHVLNCCHMESPDPAEPLKTRRVQLLIYTNSMQPRLELKATLQDGKGRIWKALQCSTEQKSSMVQKCCRLEIHHQRYFENIINSINKSLKGKVSQYYSCATTGGGVPNSIVPSVFSCRGELVQKLKCCINITSTLSQPHETEPTTRGWFSNWNSLIHVCWHAQQKVAVSPAAMQRCSTVSLNQNMCTFTPPERLAGERHEES